MDILAQLSQLFGGTNGGAGASDTITTGAPDSLFSSGAQPLNANGWALGGAAKPGSAYVNPLDNAGTGGLGAGLGWNVGTGQLALGGLGALTSLWGGLQSNKLANDQFKFTKQTTNTNLNNQIKSYNTSLEDRINARAAVQGNDQAYVQDYLSKNKLTR